MKLRSQKENKNGDKIKLFPKFWMSRKTTKMWNFNIATKLQRCKVIRIMFTKTWFNNKTSKNRTSTTINPTRNGLPLCPICLFRPFISSNCPKISFFEFSRFSFNIWWLQNARDSETGKVRRIGQQRGRLECGESEWRILGKSKFMEFLFKSVAIFWKTKLIFRFRKIFNSV